MRYKWVSVLLSACLVFGGIPTPALAEMIAEPPYGEPGVGSVDGETVDETGIDVREGPAGVDSGDVAEAMPLEEPASSDLADEPRVDEALRAPEVLVESEVLEEFATSSEGEAVPEPEAGEEGDAVEEGEDTALRAADDTLPAMDAEVNEENALAILQAYDPDGYHMVSYLIDAGQSGFSNWVHGGSNAASLDTAVHEECHGYSFFRPSSWQAETIYTGSGSEMEVDMYAPVSIFPTSEMAVLIPEELRTFRYDTYVSEESTASANTDGPFGLLNEFCAYSWGMHNQLSLFDYYRDYRVADDPLDVFGDFVNQCSNNRQAYAEFRYWTLRYLAYAKENHPEVYAYFLSNQSFVDAFCTTQSRFETMIDEFEARLDDVVAYGDEAGYSVVFKNGMFWSYDSSGRGRGRGIEATEYQLMMSEIAKPEYQLIDAALHGQKVGSVADATVAPIPPQTYTGEEVTPAVTVELDGVTLIEDADYEVSYADNVAPGTATVTITGVGSYEGSTTATFQILDLSRDGWLTFADGAKGYAKGGSLVKGWLDLDGGKYWFDQESGKMAVGWTDVVVDGKEMHYYFRPSGNLARGAWADIDGKKYWFRASGNMATGWADIDGRKYFFDESGQMVTGWRDIVNDNGTTNHYYFRPSGSMATGWAQIDGASYYFRPSGNMATGFTDVTDDAYKRYFDENGRMLTGWQTINGKTYYFRASGAMQTGTATIDGKAYIFSDKGVLLG